MVSEQEIDHYFLIFIYVNVTIGFQGVTNASKIPVIVPLSVIILFVVFRLVVGVYR